MSTFQCLNTAILVPVGKTLLVGTFGFSLVGAIRGNGALSECFERLIVGLLAIAFYVQGNDLFDSLSKSLADSIASLSQQEDIKSFVFESLKKASEERTPSGGTTVFNLPAFVEQAWRTGVWGILNTITDFVFLLISNVLTFSKDVLTTLLLILFPVAAGLYPVFPRILGNLGLYRLELALWIPILNLVEVTSVLVAKKYVTLSGSLGLYLTVVEIIVISLVLAIPAITHKFLSGAFAGDFESQAGVSRSFKNVVNVGKTMAGKFV